MSLKVKDTNDFLAKLIAAVVRNHMESFHCKYLSDAQMKELNPIIRNAIYTAIIYADELTEDMCFHYKIYIPDDWEKNKKASGKFKKKENSLAKLIAAVVRDKMEDFRSKYLSDAQMEELNPIIRNAIYTALVWLQDTPEAMDRYYIDYVPDYWEDCELVSL
jgi:hypothetical protein